MMTAFRRSLTTCLFLFVVSLTGLAQSKQELVKFQIEGATMGTTYHVTYFDAGGRNLKKGIDSILIEVNAAINHYDPRSEISILNKSDRIAEFHSVYLFRILKKAKEIYRASGGAFDVTAAPLINAWGFGPVQAMDPSREDIDSLRNIVGFDKITFTGQYVIKADPRMQMDFGGIGQGFGADIVSEFLQAKGIKNFLVEIGGEGIARGINKGEDRPWQIGVLDPNSTKEDQFFRLFLKITGKAFTTSGNYFNYRVSGGKKYGHTIDPRTGFPVTTNLLSVTVIAEDCTTADAWATAFMVMGLKRSIAAIKEIPGLDAIFMYADQSDQLQLYLTEGIKPFIISEDQ